MLFKTLTLSLGKSVPTKMDKHLSKFYIPVLLILIGFTARLVPHPANFTPIVTTALFSGAYLSKKYAFIIPITIMLLTDLFLGFNKSTPIVYSCFLVTGLIGLWLKDHNNLTSIFGATVSSSLIFYFVTNFNYWYTGALYSRDMSGLISSYIAALPFFKNELAGSLIYTGLFFGGYELIKKFTKVNKLALN